MHIILIMIINYLNLIVFLQYLSFSRADNLTSVRFVVMENVGWEVSIKDDNTYKFEGVIGKEFESLIKIFRKTCNFTAVFTEIKGSCTENGLCDGIYKLLSNGDADFAHLPSSGFNIGPLKVSSPIGEEYFDIISFPSPKDLQRSSIINLSLSVWYRILFVIIFCSIFHYIQSKDSWFLVFFKIIRLIINPLKVNEKNFLLVCEIFFAFIITNLFFCAMSSCLVSIDSSKIIKTFEDLQNSEKYAFIRNDSYIYEYIMTNERYTKLSKHLKIWKDVKDWSVEWPELLEDSRNHVLLLNNFENTGFAYSFVRFYSLENYFRSTEHLLHRSLFVLISPLAMQKIKNLVNFGTYGISQSGIWEHVVNLHIIQCIGECYSCELTNIRDIYENVYLTFSNIHYLLQAPLITLIAAIITLFFEICLKMNIRCRTKSQKSNIKLIE